MVEVTIVTVHKNYFIYWNTVMETGKKRNILQRQDQLGPFPMERLKHVDQPTNTITDAVQRIDLRNNAYGQAARGEEA